MNYPEYIELKNGTRYKINTDFRVAIKCNEIATDEDIGDYERALAIIYTLFGEEALINTESHNEIIELAKKYLSCGVESDNKKYEEPDMDYIQDLDYIEASFMSDYGIDLENTKMHFWKFNKLISGLSNSEMGNCCILNRVRNIRNMNLKNIKDPKERKKIIEAKKQVALKKKEKKRNFTVEEENNIKEFLEKAGIRKEE